MLVRTVLILTLLALPAAAQQSRDETLADIKQQLTFLRVEMQKLNRELNTTGAASVQFQGTGFVDRVNGIERELERLTGKTEELENRINQVVADGTNRIGDLEFRLTELAGGDLSKIGDTKPLGGQQAAAAPAPQLPPAQPPGAQMAVAEEADFKAARAAFESGDYPKAQQTLDNFVIAYPVSPLLPAAYLLSGRTYEAQGQARLAAKAYLDSYNADLTGPSAPTALLQLGLALDRLQERERGCIILSEVTNRFPASDASVEAQAARANLGCS